MNINLNVDPELFRRLVLAVERIAEYIAPELPDMTDYQKPRPTKKVSYRDKWQQEQEAERKRNQSILNPNAPTLRPSPDQINRA